MTIALLPTSSLYRQDLRADAASAPDFTPLRDSSRFICIFSLLSSWSNKGEMQI
jgi:hypothetical protein